jgi:hypothetical protein
VANVARWLFRLFCLLALVLFAALAVVFVGVTVDQFGTKQYVTDSVGGLPPVYILSALLVLPCLAFVAGFWMLFIDTFKVRPEPPGASPEPTQMQLPRSRFERLRRWRRAPS